MLVLRLYGTAKTMSSTVHHCLILLRMLNHKMLPVSSHKCVQAALKCLSHLFNRVDAAEVDTIEQCTYLKIYQGLARNNQGCISDSKDSLRHYKRMVTKLAG